MLRLKTAGLSEGAEEKMGLKIFLDGKIVDEKDAKISVFDHGLLYGDGVFEGIRSYDCLIFKLEEHIERLFRSAESISLQISMSKEEIQQAIIDTLKANGIRDGYIRLVVTRGVGDLGLDPQKCEKPSMFIIADRIALYPEEFYIKGLKIIIAKTKRNSVKSLPPKVKSLNYLNNILARMEATQAGVVEALMLNEEGYLAECTGDNVFIVKDNKLVTPAVEAGALEGITREIVMGIARDKGIQTEEKFIWTEELFKADEVFLTGTAAEIIPVTEIDGKIVGSGSAGKLTVDFINEFRSLIKTEGVKYAL